MLTSLWNRLFKQRKTRSLDVSLHLQPNFIPDWTDFTLEPYKEKLIALCTVAGGYANAGVWSQDLIQVEIFLVSVLDGKIFHLGDCFGRGVVYTPENYCVPTGVYEVHARA